ncbi:MAG: hypothetical protein ACHQ49_10325 [Elusimicrobiota bacterium]
MGAIQVNIAIMRVFVRLRQALAADTGLSARMKNAETAIAEHDRKLTEHAILSIRPSQRFGGWIVRSRNLEG